MGKMRTLITISIKKTECGNDTEGRYVAMIIDPENVNINL